MRRNSLDPGCRIGDNISGAVNKTKTRKLFAFC